MDLIGGAQVGNVFFEVGSSATLGANSEFAGNILADASITVDTGVTASGRLLAETGAVTLDGSDTVIEPIENVGGNPPSKVPDAARTLLMLCLGTAALLAFGLRKWLVLAV